MAIEIAGLRKSFARNEVLKGIDLEVRDGELIALLGPSGSGKTTLLRIIAGLDWPDYGKLEVDGTDWLEIAARDRRIGFVFQHYALFPHMNVRKNIAFGLNMRPSQTRPTEAAITARVDELLQFLQIPHLADRLPGQLSGGQRQRVALGRALAIEPRVLLLDEPFGALDAAVRRDLRAWLRSVHDASGSTTVFVTHDQDEAFELADRVVIMGEGRIEQIGTADQIHDHPASPFVARFMGATIELPVTVTAGRATATGIDTTQLERRAFADGPATLFIRPADLTPVADPAGLWRVKHVSSTGSVLRPVLTGPEGQEITVELLRRAAPSLSPGQPVRLRVEAGTLFTDTLSGRSGQSETLPEQKPLLAKENQI